MWGMSRADRHRWAEARTLADLGELTALWLEGRISSQPGYAPGYGPDPETRSLIPTLASLNRAGYFTTSSQPGLPTEDDVKGSRWKQRAAVDGHVADRLLLDRITTAARRADLLIDLGCEPIVVTTQDGQARTGFGGRLPRGHLRRTYAGVVGSSALADLRTATHLTIAAPEYGPAGERLWGVLAAAIR